VHRARDLRQELTPYPSATEYTSEAALDAIRCISEKGDKQPILIQDASSTDGFRWSPVQPPTGVLRCTAGQANTPCTRTTCPYWHQEDERYATGTGSQNWPVVYIEDTTGDSKENKKPWPPRKASYDTPCEKKPCDRLHYEKTHEDQRTRNSETVPKYNAKHMKVPLGITKAGMKQANPVDKNFNSFLKAKGKGIPKAGVGSRALGKGHVVGKRRRK
jgi:hypothetical protein